jgi:hypothetical protein
MNALPCSTLLPLMFCAAFSCNYALVGMSLEVVIDEQDFDNLMAELINDPDPLQKELDVQLLEAVEKEDVETVKNLLGVDTLEALNDSFGIAAVELCDMINTCVPRAHPNTPQSSRHHSPLFIAAGKGNAEIVKVLIAAKAEIDVKDFLLQITPLVWAAFHGHTEVVRLLLEAGANPNYAIKCIALYDAAKQGYPDIVKLLLDHRADTSIRYRSFDTRYHPSETALEAARSELACVKKNDPNDYIYDASSDRIQRLEQVIAILEEHEQRMGAL